MFSRSRGRLYCEMTNKLKEIINDIEINEILKFIVAGVIIVIVDSVSYYLFYFIASVPIAKGLAYILGMTTSYFINKFWTFSQKEFITFEPFKFILLYITSLLFNVGVNSFILTILPSSFIIAYICATGTSTSINFIGQKWWVFKKKYSIID